jgi:Family of unknown function (DUF5329)
MTTRIVFFVVAFLASVFGACRPDSRPEQASDGTPGPPGGRSVSGSEIEIERTQALIRIVEQLDGAVFVRNGTDYTPAEAAAHLRRKYESSSASIRTAREFIDSVATRSSFSGEEYSIRHRDGRVETASAFLNSRLSQMEDGK